MLMISMTIWLKLGAQITRVRGIKMADTGFTTYTNIRLIDRVLIIYKRQMLVISLTIDGIFITID